MSESAHLTDEQIMELAKTHTWFNGSHAMTNYVAFARAVLDAAGALPPAPSIESVYAAWRGVGADIAGLDWRAFVALLDSGTPPPTPKSL